MVLDWFHCSFRKVPAWRNEFCIVPARWHPDWQKCKDHTFALMSDNGGKTALAKLRPG